MKPKFRSRFAFLAVSLSVLSLLLPAEVQGAPQRAELPSSIQPEGKHVPAMVVLEGRPVIEITWGTGNFTPQIRAEGISHRLLGLAADDSKVIDLTTEETELSTDVKQGNLILASVFDGDAQAAGTTKTLLAHSWQISLTQAIAHYRAEHSRGRMLERIGLTILVVLVTLTVLWGMVLLSRRIRLYAINGLLQRLSNTRGKGLSLLDVQQLSGLLLLLLRTIRLAVSLFILYIAFQLLFSIYPQTLPLGERMLDGVAQPVRQLGRALWGSLPSLIFILIIALICYYTLKLVTFAFARIGEGHVHIEGFRPQWAAVTARLFNVAIILLGVLIAYPYIPGSQSAAFKGFSLFLGVLVSLGSTGVVANVLNGILLTYMDSFQKGDFVQIGTAQGYVEATSLFVTRLRTRQQTVITVPNSQVLSGQIVNYSAAAESSLTLSTTAGIGYDTPWRQVEAMLIAAAKKTRTVKQTPSPFVLEMSLNSFDITYELTVFLTGEIAINVVRAELNRNILDEFNQYGVQIMTPTYVADPPKPAVVEKHRWYASPATPPIQMPPE